MSSAMVLLGIDRLTREERIALALEIWESLGSDRSAGLTEAQQAELARRDAELDADPNKAITWDQIRTRVEGQR